MTGTFIEHGGQRLAAAKQYQIPIAEWLDLSTGINPNGWPVPEVPAEYWQRLPESQDGLEQAAQNYYQCPSLLPVPGSQAAIQSLPLLRPASRVGIISPGYAEHALAWRKAGHHTRLVSGNDINSHLDDLEVLVIINPNNPTGQYFTQSDLLKWHQQLKQRGGWLVIDEAFIDCTPEYSLSTHSPQQGLVILRSIGKFFGLAGMRCGFVLAETGLLNQLNDILGPWTISNPSRYIATTALLDRQWQQQTRKLLRQQAERLNQLLACRGLSPKAQTPLYQWIENRNADEIHQQLAKQGILVRFFHEPASLRFGLPKNELQWEKLAKSLDNIQSSVV